MCVFTSIFAAIGTAIGTAAAAVGSAVGGGLAAIGTSVAGTVGITGLSAGAATAIGAGTVGLVGTGLGLGISKMRTGSQSSGNISISSETLQQQPTSLTDTVSKSANKLVDTNKKSNPLSSLRIKQTMNNKQETGMNTANDSGTGLNLGG